MYPLNRRSFLGFSLAAVGGIFVPRYERWYRQGSGLLVPRLDGHTYVVSGVDLQGRHITLTLYNATLGGSAGQMSVARPFDFPLGSMVRIHDETLN